MGVAAERFRHRACDRRVPSPPPRRILALSAAALLAAALAGLAVLVVRTDPAEAQTTTVWSGTLTVDSNTAGGITYRGCTTRTAAGLDSCQISISPSQNINSDLFPGVLEVFGLYTTQGSFETSLKIEFTMDSHAVLSDGVRGRGALTVGGITFHFLEGIQTIDSVSWEDPGITWTEGQSVSVSLEMHASLPDSVVREYGWCFDRMSEDACGAAIVGWKTETSLINLYSSHCPRTHSIRIAASYGTVCEQSYYPANPYQDTAGPTEPMRHSDEGNWTDGGSSTYSGDPRGCNTNGHPYYMLPRDRWHGPRKGCHKHDSGDTHEHGVGKHGSGPAGLNQLTRP